MNRTVGKTSTTRISSLRLGLCCQFSAEPVRFRSITATGLLRMPTKDRHEKLASICSDNGLMLMAALQFCSENAIGSFRVTSRILPVKTHPVAGYSLDDLPGGNSIIQSFRACGDFASKHNIRTVFHPDQFVVLNSPREEVVENSIRELEYLGEVAEWIGADVINIHGGGAYGNKPAALDRFGRNLDRLSDRIRARLTLENDDRIYTPADLLPLCQSHGIPMVYDVHHHRCLTDGMTVEQATNEALATWNREPLFHVSSPKLGWSGKSPSCHHDFISVADFPKCWMGLPITVEVEAKAKELAVLRLMDELGNPDSSSTPRQKSFSRVLRKKR